MNAEFLAAFRFAFYSVDLDHGINENNGNQALIC